MDEMEALRRENAALKDKVAEIESANKIFMASFQSLSADRHELLRYRAAEAAIRPLRDAALRPDADASASASGTGSVETVVRKAIEPCDRNSTPCTLASLQSARSATSSQRSSLFPWGSGLIPSPRTPPTLLPDEAHNDIHNLMDELASRALMHVRNRTVKAKVIESMSRRVSTSRRHRVVLSKIRARMTALDVSTAFTSWSVLTMKSVARRLLRFQYSTVSPFEDLFFLTQEFPSDLTSETSGGARDTVEEAGALGGASGGPGQKEEPLSEETVAADVGEDLVTVPRVILLSAHGWRRRSASKASGETPASNATTGSLVSEGSEIPRRAPDIVAFALDFHELERRGNAEEAAVVAAAAVAAAAASTEVAADTQWQQREWQKALMWQDFVYRNLEALK